MRYSNFNFLNVRNGFFIDVRWGGGGGAHKIFQWVANFKSRHWFYYNVLSHVVKSTLNYVFTLHFLTFFLLFIGNIKSK